MPLAWFQSTPPSEATPKVLGSRPGIDMVALKDLGLQSLHQPGNAHLADAAAANGIMLDYKCAAHIRWNPRKDPERAPEVMRQLRDILDRTGLSKLLNHLPRG